MARKYKPATFQPTVRPDWGGILSYLSSEEKSNILEALIKYPSIECNSKFWIETIKPDLEIQYEEFTKQCQAKSRAVRNRWGKTSITPLQHNYNICNTDVIVSEGEGEGEGEGISESKKVSKENLKEKDFGEFTEVMNEWLDYKKSRRESYKSDKSIQTCFAKLKKLSGENAAIAKEIIQEAIANNWAGFFALKNKLEPEVQEELITIAEGEFYLDNSMPDFQDMTDGECDRAYAWLLAKFYCQNIPKSRFVSLARKFKVI